MPPDSDIDWSESIWAQIFEPLFHGAGLVIGFLYAHLLTWVGFALGLAIILAMLREKRNPSNFFAWSLAIVLLPWLGVPLYLMFGGRKSRRIIRRKRETLAATEGLSGTEGLNLGASAPVTGNAVVLLEDGVQAFKALLEQIESARESIHIMTYILSPDAAGRAVVEALTRRAASGVSVRLLIDSFGSFGSGNRWLNPLRENGGEVVRFLPLLPLHGGYSANLRNHRKVAIFDHRRVITGGQNIDLRFMGPPEHAGNCFADLSILVEGPATLPLQQVFLADWIFASGQSLQGFQELLQVQPERCGESCLQVFENGPDLAGDPLYDQILTLVQDARHTITMVTPYFVPDEVLYRSLLVKAASGRRVRLLLPRRSNHIMVDLARYRYCRRLVDAGAEILFYTGGMIHAKLLIVDGEKALSGSANFDMRSLFVNFEVGVVHSTLADVRAFESWTENILTRCVPAADVIKTAPHFWRRSAESAAHLLSPLL